MNIKGLYGNGYVCCLYIFYVNLNNIFIDVYYEFFYFLDSFINFFFLCDILIQLVLIIFFYRYMFGLVGIFFFVQFLGFVFMLESLWWLIINEREEYVCCVFQIMRGYFDIDEEFDSIKNSYFEV